VVKIKASILAGIRPSAMIFHEQPMDSWNKFDFLLLEAYQMLEDETCNECGSPIWICRNEEAANVGFKVKIAKCFAKAELDRWHEQQEKKKSKQKNHGEYPYAVAYTYDDGPMPTRMEYYKGLSKG
jgi:hypothetical protein